MPSTKMMTLMSLMTLLFSGALAAPALKGLNLRDTVPSLPVSIPAIPSVTLPAVIPTSVVGVVTSDANPVASAAAPVLSPVLSIARPIASAVAGLPVIGDPLNGIAKGLNLRDAAPSLPISVPAIPSVTLPAIPSVSIPAVIPSSVVSAVAPILGPILSIAGPIVSGLPVIGGIFNGL